MRDNDEHRSRLSTSQETHWLRAELERSRHDLQEDLSHIESKLQRTRARLRPATFIGDKALLLLGVSFALGFAIGYWDVPIGDISKPIARTMLTTVGRQMVARAIKG
jgi:hypothetical protein